MKYKNIIFDFGNVIAEFDEEYLLGSFFRTPEEKKLFADNVFPQWHKLDEGTATPEELKKESYPAFPEEMKEGAEAFFEGWYRKLKPLEQTWELIRELKEEGYRLYILSNASVQFAEHADFYGITELFDGAVYSAVIRQAKPEPGIYKYLFETYGLKPEESFFLDDLEANIEAGKKLGMDGMVYCGDARAAKQAIQKGRNGENR